MPAHSRRTVAVAVLVAGLETGFAQLPAPSGGPSMHFEVIGKSHKLDPDMQDLANSIMEDLGDLGFPSKPPSPKLRDAKPPPGAKPMHDIYSFPPLPPLPPLPMEDFQDLFPGPLIFDDGRDRPMDIFGSGIPDPLVMEMLGETHSGFQDDVVPMAHAAQAARHAPDVCFNDVLKHCRTIRSPLHCLGQHQADISEKCRDSVSKSVPFLCVTAIDQYCDILQGSVLPCLEGHMSNLGPNCQDAVVATRGIITTANTHTVSVGTASATPSLQTFAEAVRKQLGRRAAQLSSSSEYEIASYVLFILFLLAIVIVHTAPAIYGPGWMSSWYLVRKVQAALRKQFSKLGSWGGSAREADGLLDCTELKM